MTQLQNFSVAWYSRAKRSPPTRAAARVQLYMYTKSVAARQSAKIHAKPGFQHLADYNFESDQMLSDVMIRYPDVIIRYPALALALARTYRAPLTTIGCARLPV